LSDYSRIPPTTIETLERWVSHGVQPGSFVRAVLCNNLLEACNYADDFNAAALLDIVAWVANKVPAHCWGSEVRFRAWADYKRAERAKASAEVVLEI
jgi:hypothetical protein